MPDPHEPLAHPDTADEPIVRPRRTRNRTSSTITVVVVIALLALILAHLI